MSGLVVWLTGLPSSGKSTLAREVHGRAGPGALLLDGDDVRAALRPPPGHDEAGRDAFYETLARLAALAASQGLTVLVPATAHREAFRARARTLAPRFMEVFVDTPVAECERRDAKGLYARARRGEIADFPGVQLVFEPPADAEVRVGPDDRDAASRVLARIAAIRSAER